jgi:hypothetical protein
MGQWKIACSLDGREPESRLYGEFTERELRIFPHAWHALPVQDYLLARARSMRWESEPPNYQLVPTEE